MEEIRRSHCLVLTANKDNINDLMHADALYSGSVSVTQPELIRSSNCDDNVRFYKELFLLILTTSTSR